MNLIVIVLIFFFGLNVAQSQTLDSAPSNNSQRHKQARLIIEAHYFEQDSPKVWDEAKELLEANIAQESATLEDYLLLARAYFLRSARMGDKKSEDDITEALNILSRAKLKFPQSPAPIFYIFYYNLFSEDRYRKGIALNDMVQSMKVSKRFGPDMQAIYYLTLGAVAQSKDLLQVYLNQDNTSALDRAQFLDHYGSLMLELNDATLARQCVEVYERAITERPEVALYYAKAAICASRGIDFDRSHLYFKNAYNLMKDVPSYRKAYAGSLIVQLLMKKDQWDAAKQLSTVREAYDLSPTKETFAVMLEVSLEHETTAKQFSLLKSGEEYFKDQIYDFYLFLYHQQKSGDVKSPLRRHVLAKIIEHSKTLKHQALYAYVSFLESVEFKETLSYRKAAFAKAFQKARACASHLSEENICRSIFASLYLFQYLQTENIKKLMMADKILKQSKVKGPDIIHQTVLDLAKKIDLKNNYQTPGLFDEIKRTIARYLKTYLDLNVYDFNIERQMFASIDYRQKVLALKFDEDNQIVASTNAEDQTEQQSTAQENEGQDDKQDQENESAAPEAKSNLNTASKVLNEKVANAQIELKERTELSEKLDQIHEHLRLKQYPQAIAGYESLLTHEKMRPVALQALAPLHHDLKQYDRSLKYNEELLKIDPNNKKATIDKAHLLSSHMKRFESDYDFYLEADRKFPNQEDILAGLLQALYNQGMNQAPKFESVAKRIISGRFNKELRAKAHMNLGNMNLTKKDYSAAVKNYESCAQIRGQRHLKTCQNSLKYTCSVAPDKKSLSGLCRS